MTGAVTQRSAAYGTAPLPWLRTSLQNMTDPQALSTARTMWTLLEPLHGVTYFSPQARQALEEAGLRGFWRGYFAGRAAPLGPVGPAVVNAIFYNFAPQMVYRALPDVWERATPPVALAARVTGSATALRDALPGDPAPAVAVLEQVAGHLNYDGRTLSAANAELPPSSDPYERLWELATLFREHRGDGHFAALVAADINGLESLTLRTGMDVAREVMQPARGWTDEEWAAAQARLADRGLLDAEGRITDGGRQAYAAVEEATDRSAAACWQSVPPDELAKLADELAPMAAAVPLPPGNPIGTPPPARPQAD